VPPLDALPADQRAAVQLLLKQGQTYDQLADLLGIDPDGVRARAHAALDALGPDPGPELDAAARADVADYLLGQQSVSQREATRDLLSRSDDARDWAGAVAGSLEPLAGGALPEVPGAGTPAAPPETEVYEDEPAAETWPEREPVREEEPVRDEPVREEPLRDEPVHEEPPREDEPLDDEPPLREETPARERVEEDEGPAGFEDDDEPAAFDFPAREKRAPRERAPRAARTPAGPRAPSSRLGGALLLGGIGIVVAVILIFIIGGGDDSKDKASTVSRTAPTQTSTTAQTPTAQINLVSASGNSRQVGLAQIFEQGNRRALIVAGQGLSAGAYALWLYNDDNDAKLLGFVPQRVGSDGRFATQGELPTDAEKYKQLVVTKEKVTSTTKAPPKKPGRVVLQGDLKLG
jgi:hypothetical protein